METIGSRLRYVRTKNGHTQSELASRLGVADRTYKYYEADERVMQLDTAVDFANVFSLDLNWLGATGFDRAFTFERYAELFGAFLEAREAYVDFEKRDVGYNDATEGERMRIRAAGQVLEAMGGAMIMSASIRAFFPDDAARTLRAGDELNHLWSGIGGWLA